MIYALYASWLWSKLHEYYMIIIYNDIKGRYLLFSLKMLAGQVSGEVVFTWNIEHSDSV